MAISNRERLSKGLDALRTALIPYVETELKSHDSYWREKLEAKLNLVIDKKTKAIKWDSWALLKTMEFTWREVFGKQLSEAEHANVIELKKYRNDGAHEQPLSNDDTDRALDTIRRLLQAIGAAPQADDVSKVRVDLQRSIFDEQARNKTRYQVVTTEGAPKAGLKPWRELIKPHSDVIKGTFTEAEFAADLAQVARGGKGPPEYFEPEEFFRRTFITAGLKDLLISALKRLNATGGDPVVELQTNFGGGKTHSMLALFHLFGGAKVEKLPGLDALLLEAGGKTPPKANRAVLVGTDLSPAIVRTKSDGTKVHTLWGELAWQLGKKDGYKLVKDADTKGVSPGAEVFAELFEQHTPCLVLIDEWVAYARQTVKKVDIPGGNFDAQSSFAQALTEAAKRVPKAMVVASLPASQIEVGGEYGQEALTTLKDIFQRLATAWKPASADEGFQIVSRRLFEPMTDEEAFAHRDAVIAHFMKMYRDSPNEFPDGCREDNYRRQLIDAYPIHPELLNRLYGDWSTLDKFQRTRGVLRLLANVIYRLSEANDGGLLILPSMVPVADASVKAEFTRYISDVWTPIIDQDVDGEASLPLQLERGNANMMQVSAGRRVARTLFIGTAPETNAKNPGIDDRQVRLGCAQPGEAVSRFGDALRHLASRGKYIHQEGARYWLSTKANLNREAEYRAQQYLRDPEFLHVELRDRMMKEQRTKGDFAAVHPFPESSAEVPDDPEARLVILSSKAPHQAKADDEARAVARDILANRGSTPRLEKNCLVFLAADKKELPAVFETTAKFLAWKSIVAESEKLNLDKYHEKQAKTRLDEMDELVGVRISTCWRYLMVPRQETPTSEVTWEDHRIAENPNERLPAKASTKAKTEDALLPRFGGQRLRLELERVLWEGKPHVAFGRLAECFPRYLYLPRLKDRGVLEDAVVDGVKAAVNADETFATAASWDEAKKRYRGLAFGAAAATPVIDSTTLVVRADLAKKQIDEEAAAREAGTLGGTPAHGVSAVVAIAGGTANRPGAVPPVPPPNVFVASVRLNPERIVRDFGQINEAVLQHLTTLPGADADITLEVRIRIEDGVSDDVQRRVKENANTLKFTSHSFEHE